ncbi:MAG: ATP-binding cassette domain-containing protein [Cellulosilyticum sp.]|nr:ATP-binding cassette domain-containing protein [Cellulosilyticum sp.]
MALFKIEDLSFKYPQQKDAVLKQIHLEIQEGSFVTICGESGCGKTTLLRHLKPALTPYGHRKGKIYFKNQPLESLDDRSQTMKLGYVLQNPEQQIVTDKVWHELAFGLENLGYDTQTIRLRVAEMANFFGITHWFHQSVSELSGGQKQLLNLAAIMAMQPEVLILDEPTAQLDPIAAKSFIEMLKRINVELGVTVILSEHRLEDVLPISSEVIVMEKGEKLIQETVVEVGRFLAKEGHKLFKAMPVAMQVSMATSDVLNESASVVTVRDGRNWLRKWLVVNDVTKGVEPKSRNNHLLVEKTLEKTNVQEILLQLKEVYFKYDRADVDILKGLSYEIKKGKFYAIVGANGTGKTTTLSVIAGLYKPYRGKIKWAKKEIKKAMLPQNPQELFEWPTVREELIEMIKGKNKQNLAQASEEKILEVARLLSITEVLERHPYDLSGGQMQCVALAKILLLEPEVLLLDEPTKGMDASFKEKLGDIFRILISRGMTLIMVSHDLDFCARYSDECALFFDGQVISSGKPHEFFSGNSFYTTSANRMSRDILEGCITSEEVIRACQTHLRGENIGE